jgi:hypothetical protein
MRGETMSEGMATDPLGEVGSLSGPSDGFLQAARIKVMAAGETGVGSVERLLAGKTYCQSHSRLAFGYLRSRAKGR